MHYLYRHIRLDKNEPFYIGIGTKPKAFLYYSTEYNRAYNKSRRNNIWKKITNKTSYEVEILLESDDYDFIKQKEIEFIALYGRINNKTGILTNLTDGGEGTKGLVISLSTREKIGLNNVSKGKFGKDNPRSKKIYQYDLEGNFIKEWDSLADVGRFFNMPNKRIPSFKSKTFKGYQWHYDFLGVQIKKVDYTTGLNNRLVKICVPIYKYDLNNNFLCKYNSYSDAYRDTGISINGIWGAIHRKNNICKGYIWTKQIINK
jgi:hypothetical protein